MSVGSRSLLYENGGFSCYVAGKVASAVDVMRIEELAVGEELVFLVHGSLNFRLVLGVLDVRVPDVEEVIRGFPLAVHVAVDIAIAAAEKLTSYVSGVDADVGVGADLSQIAATEDVAIHVRCLFG